MQFEVFIGCTQITRALNVGPKISQCNLLLRNGPCKQKEVKCVEILTEIDLLLPLTHSAEKSAVRR